MKIKLLPSSFDEKGEASPEQHLTCYLLDDRVALDAGSLSLTFGQGHRRLVRDIIITHPHLDHTAGLPFFIDDLFEALQEPVRVHGTEEAIDALEDHIFNWKTYPRFSEIQNNHGRVMEYHPFKIREEFQVAHLKIKAIPVNHQVPTVGLIISDGKSTIALSSDTAETDEFWQALNNEPKLDALLVESSFPNELEDLARSSYHLTPRLLKSELAKLKHQTRVLAVHLKPAYYEQTRKELDELGLANLEVMRTSEDYLFGA
jgi:ribonuclease BN (tRNA processing enzyme)